MEDNILIGKDLHKPTRCSKCGGELRYEGCGEFICTECGNWEYDDYGKVRNYLETHRGATQTEVSHATGVSTSTIRYLLREDKIEVSPTSAIYLYCEVCGAPIRSGRFCNKCSLTRSNNSQNESSAGKNKNIMGFGMSNGEINGARRFQR